eukprot:1187420-Prorocentrum_minimum.AAC.3
MGRSSSVGSLEGVRSQIQVNFTTSRPIAIPSQPTQPTQPSQPTQLSQSEPTQQSRPMAARPTQQSRLMAARPARLQTSSSSSDLSGGKLLDIREGDHDG